MKIVVYLFLTGLSLTTGYFLGLNKQLDSYPKTLIDLGYKSYLTGCMENYKNFNECKKKGIFFKNELAGFIGE